jgi:hypothetical protein
MNVEEVLKIDAANRRPATNAELYKLEDIVPKEWDYSLPTFASQENVFLKKQINQMTSEKFRDIFFNKYPELTGINWENVLIAGGCVGSGVAKNFKTTDIDFFLYGFSTIEEAEKKIREIYDYIVEYEINKKKNDFEAKQQRKKETICSNNLHLHSPDCFKKEEFKRPNEDELGFHLTKTRNCLTILSRDRTIYQFIFRLYSTKSEILHGFDLGSSAIGFDGTTVWLTPLGKFAYENCCNIIDTTRRSLSYERRLHKYFTRGFEIILPSFNISKIRTALIRDYNIDDYIIFPNFVVRYYAIVGNKIIVRSNFIFNNKKGNEHDYVEELKNNEYALFNTNIYNLLRERYENIIFMGNTYNAVYSDSINCSKAKLEYFYQKLKEQIQNRKQFPTQKVINYIITDSPEEIFTIRNKPDLLESVIKENKGIVTTRLENVGKTPTWVTKNPGTQLSGSFNPIIEEPEKWYGKYYKKPVENNNNNFFSSLTGII